MHSWYAFEYTPTVVTLVITRKRNIALYGAAVWDLCHSVYLYVLLSMFRALKPPSELVLSRTHMLGAVCPGTLLNASVCSHVPRQLL